MTEPTNQHETPSAPADKARIEYLTAQLAQLKRDYAQLADLKRPEARRYAAFPMSYEDADNQHGMTLRDYFAAAALQGLIAYPSNPDELELEFAKAAYEYADEMMEARDR